jgi:transposase
MHSYPRAAVERMMKIQEVILRAMAKKITWWQAAEVIGMSDRQMRRLHWRYREHGYDGLLDRRVGQPSPKRVPLAVVEQVLGLYQQKYFDLNVRHFHEKLEPQHQIRLSDRWVKKALQGAGLVRRERKRGVHRRRRERRPLPGMLLHIDGSRHRWFQDDRWYDLLVILDDATSEIYYAQLVQQESTMTVRRALREVIERQGIFCALYSDRASHFFYTPRAGGKVDGERATQVGGALQELNIRMIPAYSPQALGRSERGFGTWQGRLRQELRLQGIVTLEGANQFLREQYMAEFNQRFPVAALPSGSAFLPCRRKDLDVVFSVQQQRVVNRDNPVVVGGTIFQIQPRRWRGTLAGCSVMVCEHLDQLWSIRYGPHVVGIYNAQEWPWRCERKQDRRARAVGKPLRGKVKITFPLRLGIPQTARDSHFPTAPAAVHQP